MSVAPTPGAHRRPRSADCRLPPTTFPESAHDSPCGRRHLPRLPGRQGRRPRRPHRRRRARRALARRPRPQGRGRRGAARRLLLRRLPALRRHRPVLPHHGRDRAGRALGQPARAGHLQRLPDPVREPPAARRAHPQPVAAFHQPRHHPARGVHRHGLDQPLHLRRGDPGRPQERRGLLRRRPRHPGRTGAHRPRRRPLRRGRAQRLAARDRRNRQRARQRGGPDAAPRTRRRGPDRPSTDGLGFFTSLLAHLADGVPAAAGATG